MILEQITGKNEKEQLNVQRILTIAYPTMKNFKYPAFFDNFFFGVQCDRC